MLVNENYKEFECIKRMESPYKENFYKLVDNYGSILNKGNAKNSSVYTLHTFNNHCFNIFKIISEIILNVKTAYSDQGLTKIELYILNLAVLFHDISMAANINWNRAVHSRQSAEYVEEEYENASSALSKIGGINKNEKDALKLIIEAHSNIKDDSVKDEYQGVFNPKLTNALPASVGQIRGKILAGILRIADEMDITSDRIGNNDLMKQLEKSLEDKREDKIKEGESKENNNDKVSLTHWRKLQCFSYLELERENKTQVNLIVDDDYVSKKLDDLSNITDMILDVWKKINSEFKIIESVFKADACATTFITIRNIEIKTAVADLQKNLEDKKIDNNLVLGGPRDLIENNSNKLEEDLGNSSEHRLEYPLVLNSILQNKIYNWINSMGLTKYGHFTLNDTYCARDWVDTYKLVENEDYCEQIVDVMSQHIQEKNTYYGDYIIIGLDLEGMLVASKIAFKLQKPFSYIIPAKKMNMHSEPDKKFDFDGKKNIILITDAIVTLRTINEAQELYSMSEDKVKAIYTILYRLPSDPKIVNQEIHKKIFSLNNNFDIEVFPKANCKYTRDNPQNCKAVNKKLK